MTLMYSYLRQVKSVIERRNYRLILLIGLPLGFYILTFFFTTSQSFTYLNYYNNPIPPAKSIYFHETFGKGVLNSRQACSVESAAKAHPGWQVNVLFVNYLHEENFDIGKILHALKKYPNINFAHLDLIEYAKNTPLENMFSTGAFNSSHWKMIHISDALRFLTLYKWSGIYLDMDVIVAKSFDNLVSNWGASESKETVAAGAISLSNDNLGRQVATAAVHDFKNNFRGDLWSHNGPGVMTRILKKMCKTKIIAKMSASNCKGFEVYGPKLFYPISWQNAKDYFSSKNLKLGDPYTYHVWNHLTANYRVKNTTLYAKLAKKYCPTIYEAYGNNFGQ